MSGPSEGSADRRDGRENDMDLVIFLRDPLMAQPHEPDINALLGCVMSMVFHWRRISQRRNASERRLDRGDLHGERSYRSKMTRQSE